jgi:hypothetical protein
MNFYLDPLSSLPIKKDSKLLTASSHFGEKQ